MKKIILLGLVTVVAFSSCKKKGCMDPNANNFNAEAEKDDGSCTYDDTTTPPPVTLVVIEVVIIPVTGPHYQIPVIGPEIDFVSLVLVVVEVVVVVVLRTTNYGHPMNI